MMRSIRRLLREAFHGSDNPQEGYAEGSRVLPRSNLNIPMPPGVKPPRKETTLEEALILAQARATVSKVVIPPAPEEGEPEFQAADGTVRKKHYGEGKQPWDHMVDLDIAFEFAIGCIIKYPMRDPSVKGISAVEDYKKARWYLARVEEMLLEWRKQGMNDPTTRRRRNLYNDAFILLTPEQRHLLGFARSGQGENRTSSPLTIKFIDKV